MRCALGGSRTCSADAILDFGEANRKTALSRALGAAFEGGGDAAFRGVGLLQEHGLCKFPGPGKPNAERERDDLWAEVGVRLCATLHFRSGRYSLSCSSE